MTYEEHCFRKLQKTKGLFFGPFGPLIFRRRFSVGLLIMALFENPYSLVFFKRRKSPSPPPAPQPVCPPSLSFSYYFFSLCSLLERGGAIWEDCKKARASSNVFLLCLTCMYQYCSANKITYFLSKLFLFDEFVRETRVCCLTPSNLKGKYIGKISINVVNRSCRTLLIRETQEILNPR